MDMNEAKKRMIIFSNNVFNMRRKGFDTPLNGDRKTFFNYTVLNLIFFLISSMLLAIDYVINRGPIEGYSLCIIIGFMLLEIIIIVYCSILRREAATCRPYLDEAMISNITLVNLIILVAYVALFFHLFELIAIMLTLVALVYTFLTVAINKNIFSGRGAPYESKVVGMADALFSSNMKYVVLTIATATMLFVPKGIATGILAGGAIAIIMLQTNVAAQNSMRYFYVKKYEIGEFIDY